MSLVKVSSVEEGYRESRPPECVCLLDNQCQSQTFQSDETRNYELSSG